MDVLYLTLSNPELHSTGIYADLLNALVERGHKLTIVYADGEAEKTFLTEEKGVRILTVKVGRQFGVSFFQKGKNLLLLDPKMKRAVKKYFRKEKFNLVLYATPPITFGKVVKYCKKQFGSLNYLMLKDIFPQNAVDIGLIKERSLIHKIFSKKEKELYRASTFIGCMSKANAEYIQKHHPEISKKKIEIFPNTMKVPPYIEKEALHIQTEKLGVPKGAVVFVFGGNMGKPQALEFLVNGVRTMEGYKKAYFLFVGKGSEEGWVKENIKRRTNAAFIPFLPPREYQCLMEECHVGIISLDARFTIPNYPSRTLAYMSMAMPILATIDRTTDLWGLIEAEAGCGLCSVTGDLTSFEKNVRYLAENKDVRIQMGARGRQYLEENFHVSRSIAILESHFPKKRK